MDAVPTLFFYSLTTSTERFLPLLPRYSYRHRIADKLVYPDSVILSHHACTPFILAGCMPPITFGGTVGGQYRWAVGFWRGQDMAMPAGFSPRYLPRQRLYLLRGGRRVCCDCDAACHCATSLATVPARCACGHARRFAAFATLWYPLQRSVDYLHCYPSRRADGI
jgi:hypothetical protein